MAEVLKKFGRYFLLDRLAQGGMAEIFRARLATPDGATRLIVIKRIQAGYGTNKEFVEMFHSEIKVTMGLSHPNIVQLYDFGEEHAQPYIVMEYCDGKNLRQFISRFSEMKKIFPVEIAAYIIEQAACGLHYAHAFKDKITGQPLNIIHRDISPQNVLISFEGNVKIIDFGIAKAATNSESTRAGVIKGKPSYLSPEQISGEKLDARCDIFALGTVFWELLTGKKLFAGENDLAVLKLIESCQSHVKPPSTINPKVPRELDYIILKALAKKREERYQTADEMQRALHKFLYAYMPDFNPADLSYYAKDLFKNEIVEDRKRIQRLNDKAEQLLSTLFTSPESQTAGIPKRPDGTSTMIDSAIKSTGAREVFTPGNVKSAKVEIEKVPDFMPKNRSFPQQSVPANASPGRVASVNRSGGIAPQQRLPKEHGDAGSLTKILLVAAGLIAGLLFLGPQFGINLISEGQKLILHGDYRNVTVTVNGRRVATRLPATVKDVPAGTPVEVVVESEGGGTFREEVLLGKNEKRDIQVVMRDECPPEDPSCKAPKVFLRLNILPALGATPRILLNNREIDPKVPIMKVPVDAHLELLIRRPGFRFLKREFTVESSRVGRQAEWVENIQLEPVKMGSLTIYSTPSAKAYMNVDGEDWVRETPLEKEAVPAGTYTINLVNKALEMEKTVSVTIREGMNTPVTVNLEPKKR